MPEWLLREVKGGVWNPRWPKSVDRLGEVRELAETGLISAKLRHHPNKRRLVIESVQLLSNQSSALESVRQRVATRSRGDVAWPTRATERQLRIAETLLSDPEFFDRELPPKLWATLAHGNSKAGKVDTIVEALGGKVKRRPSRGVVWFYGKGAITSAETRWVCDGEIAIPDALLNGNLSFEAKSVGIVENRDVASICKGLVMVLDGQPTRIQRHIVRELKAAEVHTWAWPDMDTYGVQMMRQLRGDNPDLEVRGFGEWPSEWAQPLTSDQRLQTLRDAAIQDEFTPTLDYILEHGWFEQEVIAIHNPDLTSSRVDGPTATNE